jgi:thiamine-monophosphate kinase
LVLGIGDDCAIFRPRADEDLLFTTDQMIEGVHFRNDASEVEVGHRALARSLSDIAAMGGEPRFCLVSLAVPQKRGTNWIESFYRGLLGLARRTKTALAGGDLAHASSIYCDVMVCGAHMSGHWSGQRHLASLRRLHITRHADRGLNVAQLGFTADNAQALVGGL